MGQNYQYCRAWNSFDPSRTETKTELSDLVVHIQIHLRWFWWHQKVEKSKLHNCIIWNYHSLFIIRSQGQWVSLIYENPDPNTQFLESISLLTFQGTKRSSVSLYPLILLKLIYAMFCHLFPWNVSKKTNATLLPDFARFKKTKSITTTVITGTNRKTNNLTHD